MEDGDRGGADSSRGRIFFCVGLKLLSQVKVNGAHVVESLFVDGILVGSKDAHADFVSEDL